MFHEASFEDQLAAVAGDPLRVLVAGAGVAGVTAAQLLRARGLHPVLLERSARDGDDGYMLALMPLVDPVLAELGLADSYVDNSVSLRGYRLRGHSGAQLREYSMVRLLSQFGDYRGVSRADLLGVLGSRGGTVTYGAVVSSIEQRLDGAHVTVDTPAGCGRGDFDLVIAADGMHSATRTLALGAEQVETYDTGWGGWVSWIEQDDGQDLVEELWGAGRFIGAYPVKDRLGVIVGGPRKDTRVGAERFAASTREALRSVGDRFDRVLTEIAGAKDTYYWSLTDCRCTTWSAGRVVMLGDAAAGFLPTAGIGAGMAMESAWVLAHHIGSGNVGDATAMLRDYERAQHPRVEAAQRNSRQLAKLMFLRGRSLAASRDTLTRFLPLESAIKPIRELLRDQPTAA